MNWLTIMLERDYYINYLKHLKTSPIEAFMFGVSEALIPLRYLSKGKKDLLPIKISSGDGLDGTSHYSCQPELS